ncbi:MAG TPA: AAA family ATPase [Hyphomicrobiaceae bacterium]|nr:AAA family ATPase [Hyphomicrobiaceae bacterium]
MRLVAFEVEGYRSLRSLKIDCGDLTVLAGENGVGKTNIFRALELLPAAADGSICRRLAEEGGMQSVLWSGRGSERATSLRLTARFENVAYRIEVSEPLQQEAALPSEPVVREEQLYRIGPQGTTQVLRREGASIWLRDADGKRHVYTRELLPSETAISAFRDSAQYPELALVRQLFLEWRFYTEFRMDPGAPARQKGLAVATAALAGDGSDLASVLATVYQLQQRPDIIGRALDDAFPGATLDVTTSDGAASYMLRLPDMARPLAAHEISEGTLQYLCLIAALSSFRLPRLIALNEPEAGLHPRMLPPLARLIARASKATQVWVVTHSGGLAHEIGQASGSLPRVVARRDGATVIEPVPTFRDAVRPGVQPAQPQPQPQPQPQSQPVGADPHALQAEAHRRALSDMADLLRRIKQSPEVPRALVGDFLNRLDHLHRIGAPVPPEVEKLGDQLAAEMRQQPMSGR